jgi:hypothetical protein
LDTHTAQQHSTTQRIAGVLEPNLDNDHEIGIGIGMYIGMTENGQNKVMEFT